MSDEQRIHARVSLRLDIPASKLAHLDLTTKDEDDDAPYFVAEEFIAENLPDLMEHAAMVDRSDVEVDF